LGEPHFVIDAPGGGGKVPLLPEYVQEITDDEVVFRNYEGKIFRYKQPRQVGDGLGERVEEQPGPDIVPIEIGKVAKKRDKAPKRRRTANG
jgi:hypothetical protein